MKILDLWNKYFFCFSEKNKKENITKYLVIENTNDTNESH